jgi:hypothetical protein
MLLPPVLQAVAVVQRAMRGVPPEAHMAELGFGPLLLIKAFPVNMSGAQRRAFGWVECLLFPLTLKFFFERG